MTSIADLDCCHSLPFDCSVLIAVGWLGEGCEFARGPVSLEFYRKLQSLCVEPWQPVVSAGRHGCELCQFDPPSFSDNVFIPFQGQIFVAPVAIVHYVAAHHYLPPQIFVEAVLACPPTRSMEYKRALLANGGRCLVKTAAKP